jgi:hypothetical protein
MGRSANCTGHTISLIILVSLLVSLMSAHAVLRTRFYMFRQCFIWTFEQGSLRVESLIRGSGFEVRGA